MKEERGGRRGEGGEGRKERGGRRGEGGEGREGVPANAEIAAKVLRSCPKDVKL